MNRNPTRRELHSQMPVLRRSRPRFWFAAALTCIVFVPHSRAAESFDDSSFENSECVLDESFDDDADSLGKGWKANTGRWRVAGGVLRGSEIPSDNHSAALRKLLPSENAVYRLRFRLIDAGEVLHFGFDPAPGELDKKGHLFSIVIQRGGWKILKHADKKRPQEDPNETLANSRTAVELGRWYTLQVTTWGPYVTARLDGEKLTAKHPTFDVKKPTLIFRCLGNGVEIDDLKVWRQIK